MTKPLTPNYVPGVGNLTTGRFAFQRHVEGLEFRHNATMIDLAPSLDGYTTVQALLEAIVGDLNPTMPDATPTQLGLITLGGDLNGISSSAFSPKVSGLQGRPVQNLTPTTGQVLAWSGSFWGPVSVGGDVTGPITNETIISVSGDVAGTLNLGTAASTTTINIGGVSLGEVNIGTTSIPGTSITLGTGSGSVVIPNLSGFTDAMVIANITGQLSVTPGVTYTFPGNQSLNVSATLATSSAILVGFTNVTATSNTINYTVDSGSTLDFLLLVEDAVTTGGHTRAINLPATAVAMAGRVLKIVDAFGSADIHNITINAVGGAEFPGGATFITMGTSNGAVELISDGNNWFITGSYQFP